MFIYSIFSPLNPLGSMNWWDAHMVKDEAAPWNDLNIYWFVHKTRSKQLQKLPL